MKKLLLLAAFFSMFAALSFAQDAERLKTLKQKSDDALKEMEEGTLTLRFADALTGKPIKDGKVTMKGLTESQTDFEGRFYFSPGDVDKRYLVSFRHPDYIDSDFEIDVVMGTIFRNRFSISPRMPIGYLRVVLDWGTQPRDLDAHFIKTNSYHISFRDMIVSADGIAKLDRDDTDGEGPETITATRIDQTAEYLYIVHDYSNKDSRNSDKLSKSAASVKVYSDNKLIEVFNITPDNQGTYWKVFKIAGGKVISMNNFE